MPNKSSLNQLPPAPEKAAPILAEVCAPVKKRLHHVILGVETGLKLVDVRDAWEYRELAMLFAWRDIKLRYAQTFLGVGWTIIQPLMSTGVFTVLFGKLAKMPSEGLPYPLFNFLGFLPWLFFINGVGRCSSSLVANAPVLTKVYFPRLLLPVGSMLPGFVDLFVGTASAVPLMYYFGYPPSVGSLFWIPVLTGILSLQVLGISLFLSAWNVRFRDVGNLVPVCLNMGMWVTPITYPLGLIPERYRVWVYCNPVVGIVEGFRNAFLGRPVDLSLVGISLAAGIFLIYVGLYYFRRVELTFADIV